MYVMFIRFECHQKPVSIVHLSSISIWPFWCNHLHLHRVYSKSGYGKSWFGRVDKTSYSIDSNVPYFHVTVVVPGVDDPLKSVCIMLGLAGLH